MVRRPYNQGPGKGRQKPHKQTEVKIGKQGAQSTPQAGVLETSLSWRPVLETRNSFTGTQALGAGPQETCTVTGPGWGPEVWP